MKDTIRHPYRGLRRRLGRAGALAVVGLAVCAGAALAYYVVVYSGASGSGTEPNSATGGASNGGDAVTLAAEWGSATGDGDSNLSPGVTDELQVLAYDDDPSSSDVYKLSNIAATVTTSNPSCLPSWFIVNMGPLANPPYTVSSVDTPESPTGMGSGATITFTQLPTVDQSACETASVTVNLTGDTTLVTS